jgi:hypothetical protein
LTVEDARTNVGVIFAGEFTGLFVDGDETRGERGRDIDVGPVLAV